MQVAAAFQCLSRVESFDDALLQSSEVGSDRAGREGGGWEGGVRKRNVCWVSSGLVRCDYDTST